MKIVFSAFLTVMIVSGCASVDTRLMDDLSLQQRLQHTWSYREVASNNAIVEGETSYLPDGVMNMFGHIRQSKTVQTVVASGTWHVKNGYLYSTVTSSNITGMVPNGFTSAEKLVSVNDRELTYVSSVDGRTVTERRIR